MPEATVIEFEDDLTRDDSDKADTGGDDASAEFAHFYLSDTLYFISEAGKEQAQAEAVATGFVGPEGLPDVPGASTGIDYDAAADSIWEQLRLSIALDDFDFSSIIETTKVNPAAGLEEMQLIADIATAPLPDEVSLIFDMVEENHFEAVTGDFLAFSGFDDVLA